MICFKCIFTNQYYILIEGEPVNIETGEFKKNIDFKSLKKCSIQESYFIERKFKNNIA